MSNQLENIANSVGGWIIGNFEPSAHRTEEFEVAYKTYVAGDMEAEHYHQIATEFTLIAYGKVEMLGEIYPQGSIVKVEPGQSTSFRALEDSATVVVKIPSLPNDKYFK